MSASSRTAVVAILVALAMVGVAVLWLLRDAGDGRERRRPPPLVEVTPAEQARIEERLAATGTLIAPEAVMITAEAAGRVTAIRFEEGDRVAEGDVIVELEAVRAEAEVARAAARLAEQERELERRRELYGQDFVSEGELDTAIAAVEDAEAGLKIARDALADRLLRAPFDGVTGRRLISPGALVEPGTVVTRLVSADGIDLLVDIPGTELARVHLGQRVRATTPAYPERVFQGQIRFIGTEVDTATRTLPVEARIDNSSRLLKPGLFMQAQLIVDQRRTVRVPEEALVAQGPTERIYVVDDEDRAERRSVQTGTRREWHRWRAPDPLELSRRSVAGRGGVYARAQPGPGGGRCPRQGINNPH